jgi:hypothetical protein
MFYPELFIPHTVYYDDEVLGEFVADVLVEDAVILELKYITGFMKLDA